MVNDKKIVGYNRVSSQKQDAEKYLYFLYSYEQRTGEKLDEIILEKISSTNTALKKRKLWTLILDESISKIVIPNVSRCIRSIPDAVDLTNILKTDRPDLTIHFVDRKLDLNILISKEDEHHFYELVISAAREIYQRSEIITLGLKKAKDNGVKLGRPTTSSLDKRSKEIFAYLDRGMSKAFICRAIDVNTTTLYRWLKRQEIEILEELNLDTKIYKYDFRNGIVEKK